MRFFHGVVIAISIGAKDRVGEDRFGKLSGSWKGIEDIVVDFLRRSFVVGFDFVQGQRYR